MNSENLSFCITAFTHDAQVAFAAAQEMRLVGVRIEEHRQGFGDNLQGIFLRNAFSLHIGKGNCGENHIEMTACILEFLIIHD